MNISLTIAHLSLVVGVVACSRPASLPQPPQAATQSNSNVSQVSKQSTQNFLSTFDTPKRSKYPEPFLEPDCAESKPEGYLHDAKQAVREVRTTGWPQLKACVEHADNIYGEMRTHFRLDPDGVPRCVESLGSSMFNQDVVRCVLAAYRTFRFPAPQHGSVRITDGIRFEHVEEEAIAEQK